MPFPLLFTRFWDDKGARYFLNNHAFRKEKPHNITNQLIINHKNFLELNI
jgi:hypothetical protein